MWERRIYLSHLELGAVFLCSHLGPAVTVNQVNCKPTLGSQKVKLNQSRNGLTGMGYVFRPPTHFMDETKECE